MWTEILESFLSSFSASFRYPELALKSRYNLSPLFTSKYSSSTGAFELSCQCHIFLVGQTVYLSKVCKPYWFYSFRGHFNVVAVVCWGVFVAFIIEQREFSPVKTVYLPPKNQYLKNLDQHLFCKFLYRCFLSSHS